jgi:hypothetical protein
MNVYLFVGSMIKARPYNAHSSSLKTQIYQNLVHLITQYFWAQGQQPLLALYQLDNMFELLPTFVM